VTHVITECDNGYSSNPKSDRHGDAGAGIARSQSMNAIQLQTGAGGQSSPSGRARLAVGGPARSSPNISEKSPLIPAASHTWPHNRANLERQKFEQRIFANENPYEQDREEEQ
jgi:hypothetical protein